jgi:uncharacterized Rossmann fold enzyme
VNFETWEPVYESILADMGYDRQADEAARDDLADAVRDVETVEPDRQAFEGQTVAIAAPGQSLRDATCVVAEADTVVAAGAAADQLLDAGRAVDWLVTDLDGHARPAGAVTDAGVPVAVHAHGDNRSRLAEAVPSMDLSAVLPTTQAAPVAGVWNLGGFTDGDRAAFLADAMGADRLVFAGWDLDDETVGPVKRRKLDWAARLLRWLEVRRGDSFPVLDESRARLDTSMLPIAD